MQARGEAGFEFGDEDAIVVGPHHASRLVDERDVSQPREEAFPEVCVDGLLAPSALEFKAFALELCINGQAVAYPFALMTSELK